MESEDICDNSFKIQTLRSMFEDLVSPAVIEAILESCNGDVNAAAEGIMNMTSEGALNLEDNATGITHSTTYSEPEIPFNLPGNTGICVSQTPSPETNEYYLNPAAPEFIPCNIAPETTVSESRNDIVPVPMSYADVYKNTGAVPKPKENVNQKPVRNEVRKEPEMFNIEQIQNIIEYHQQGSRVLVVMRGLPGSGKTTLARTIVEKTVGGTMQNFTTHIFSADDYFMVRGKYQFNKSLLQEAHYKNQKRVWSALTKGLSPVVVDNTNVQLWELEPYVRDGVNNGYLIEVVEPKSPWAKNANQLCKRNIHNVPKDKIKIMLEKYDNNITTMKVFETFRLSYPLQFTPPVLRKIPPYIIENSPKPPTHRIGIDNKSYKCKTESKIEIDEDRKSIELTENEPNTSQANISQEDSITDPKINKIQDNSSNPVDKTAEEDQKRLEKLLEAQKHLEEFQNLEKEWDAGESWDENQSQSPPTKENKSEIFSPKPPRNLKGQIPNIIDDEPMIEASNICDDWSQISMYMPAWPGKTELTSKEKVITCVETASIGTGFELGDIENIHDLHNELIGTPRDINENTQLNKKEKIPHQRMLDKSTSTHDQTFNQAHRCKNEEKHYIAFKKMFKDVPRPVLREIFDKCLGDVNWAVNIVLDSLGSSPLDVGVTDNSDTEEEETLDCDCLAAYSIVPDRKHTETVPIATIDEVQIQDVAGPSTSATKKPKRERKNSEKTLELKRHIESNVVIAENYYSQHHLNLRRARGDVGYSSHATLETNVNIMENFGAEDLSESQKQIEESYKLDTKPVNLIEQEIENDDEALGACALTADDKMTESNPSDVENFFSFVNEKMFEAKIGHNKDYIENVDTDDDTSEPETVSVNIGMDFVHKLDELFGRQGIIYPEIIKPTINVPMALLTEINALWAESIAYQMEKASRQTDEMVKQDEEFARQLALKEKEMAAEGKESNLPDFREIMDMDLALSIYQKDVAEWKNNEPSDLAAKMTRSKLCDLFPDINEETLCELLMAHDNNFQSTVESLLISIGQGHILNTPNGVNKFVMEKEFEKKDKILAEQQQTLSESEWPFLPNQTVGMDTVNHYREQAERYLISRNVNFDKAKYYISRNQLAVASFFSDIASYNKQRYDKANSLAAASLIQYHATNNASDDILDLHFLRVVEAREALDLFVDSKIRKLRSIKDQGREPKAVNIYIITGRGAHSPGQPRIKPAIIRRLHDREMRYKEKNPGLLATKISYYSKMTNEVNRRSRK